MLFILAVIWKISDATVKLMVSYQKCLHSSLSIIFQILFILDYLIKCNMISVGKTSGFVEIRKLLSSMHITRILAAY